MNKWEKFYQKNNGNSFPHPSLIVFFYKYFYKSKKKKIDILDLGSGTGSILMLIKKNSFHVDLVDISNSALKKINKYKIKNIKTFNKNFNDFLKYSKKKYDLIVDSASLQHQREDDLKKSFSLINKNLKKKGYFFSINLNSYRSSNDKKFLVTKLSKNRLLSIFKLCNLKKVNYNIFYYTENNSKNFIKFNIIFGKKI